MHLLIFWPDSVQTVHLNVIFFLLPFKSYSNELVDWKVGIRIAKFGVFGCLTRNDISYQCDPKRAIPFSRPRRLNQSSCKSVKPSDLHRHTQETKVRWGKVVKKSFCGYVQPISASALSQTIPTLFNTSGNLANVINRAKVHIDR
jgi:hypothetical protein